MGLDYQTVIVAALGLAVVLVIGGAMLPLFWLRQHRQRPAQRGPAKAEPSSRPGGAVPAGLPEAADAPTPPPGPRVMGEVVLVAESGRAFTLDRLPAVVGRGPGCDARVDHPSVSTEHARLYQHPELGLVIEDLNSLNGLLVDGQPTARNALRDGMRVSLGDVTLRVQLAAAPSG